MDVPASRDVGAAGTLRSMGAGDSVSFDRAAGFYDETRRTDEAALAAMLEVLAGELAPRGSALEIGVGTGQIALPLHARGVSLTGIDISEPMMARLVDKAGGRAPFPLVRGDASQLPFADRSFGGAYARWVLHLIPDWRDAVAELGRVVQPGGVVVIEPGSYVGAWRDVWLRFVQEVGEAAMPVGLDMRGAPAELDEAFAARGMRRRDLPDVRFRSDATLERFFREAAARTHSWTWRIPDAELGRAVEVVRAWAQDRYGDLMHVPEPSVPLLWRAYDVA